MSKAILVIDMPENCDNCPVLEYCHNNDGKCDLSTRQEWCPLKEVPDTMDEQNYREISKAVKESGIPLDLQKVIQRLLDKELMESTEIEEINEP